MPVSARYYSIFKSNRGTSHGAGRLVSNTWVAQVRFQHDSKLHQVICENGTRTSLSWRSILATSSRESWVCDECYRLRSLSRHVDVVYIRTKRIQSESPRRKFYSEMLCRLCISNIDFVLIHSNFTSRMFGGEKFLFPDEEKWRHHVKMRPCHDKDVIQFLFTV